MTLGSALREVPPLTARLAARRSALTLEAVGRRGWDPRPVSATRLCHLSADARQRLRQTQRRSCAIHVLARQSLSGDSDLGA